MLVHFLLKKVNFIRQNNNFEIDEVKLEKVNSDLESKEVNSGVIKYHNNIVRFQTENIKI